MFALLQAVTKFTTNKKHRSNRWLKTIGEAVVLPQLYGISHSSTEKTIGMKCVKLRVVTVNASAPHL